MKKKTLALLLGLALTAVEITNVNALENVEVSTKEQLISCLAQDDNVCKLTDDIIMDASTEVDLRTDKKVTLDLNGHEIKGKLKYGLFVRGGDLTVDDTSSSKNGKITTLKAGGDGIAVGASGKLKVLAGTITATNGIRIYKNDTDIEEVIVDGGIIKGEKFGISAAKNSFVTIKSGEIRSGTKKLEGENSTSSKYGITMSRGAKLVVDGGTISGQRAIGTIYDDTPTPTKNEIIINGGLIEAISEDEMPPYGIVIESNDTLTINGGEIKSPQTVLAINSLAENTRIEINGGKINNYKNNSVTVFSASAGGTILLNGGLITGGTGISMRAGDLTIPKDSTAKIVAKDTNSKEIGSNVGVYVSQHATQKDININILGGTIDAEKLLYEKNDESNPKESISKIKLNVTGGNFISSGEKANVIYSEDFEKFVSGGIFNTKFETKYLVTGKNFTKTNKGIEIVDQGSLFYDNTNETILSVVDTSNLKDTIKENLEDTSLKNKDVEIELIVQEINELQQEETKKSIEEAVTKFENFEIVKYLDISLALVDTSDETNRVEVTELSDKIKLEFELPEDLKEVKEGYTRKYYVIRMHNGKVEILDSQLSSDGNSISFYTDKFSTYAVGYTDIEKIETPDTIDNVSTYVKILSLTLISMLIVFTLLRKNLKKN